MPHVRRNHRHWAQSRKKKSKAAAQQVTTVNIDSCRCQFANAIYADYLKYPIAIQIERLYYYFFIIIIFPHKKHYYYYYYYLFILKNTILFINK